MEAAAATDAQNLLRRGNNNGMTLHQSKRQNKNGVERLVDWLFCRRVPNV